MDTHTLPPTLEPTVATDDAVAKVDALLDIARCNSFAQYREVMAACDAIVAAIEDPLTRVEAEALAAGIAPIENGDRPLVVTDMRFINRLLDLRLLLRA